MTDIEREYALAKYRATANNERGRAFEAAIEVACAAYVQTGRAEIEKTPEPFRVARKEKDGVFVGRFGTHAQPDFKGTLDGGRSIVFEAKYTTTGTMRRSVLTAAQMEKLESHHRKGALAAVCVGIRDNYFFVPWPMWRDMRRLWGKQTVTAADLEPFRVRFNGAVLFLQYVHGAKGAWVEGKECEMERWRQGLD